MMKIGRNIHEGFVSSLIIGGARPPPSEILGGGAVAPLAPLVPTPLGYIPQHLQCRK